jgi:hypothetical protein
MVGSCQQAVRYMPAPWRSPTCWIRSMTSFKHNCEPSLEQTALATPEVPSRVGTGRISARTIKQRPASTHNVSTASKVLVLGPNRSTRPAGPQQQAALRLQQSPTPASALSPRGHSSAPPSTRPTASHALVGGLPPLPALLTLRLLQQPLLLLAGLPDPAPQFLASTSPCLASAQPA